MQFRCWDEQLSILLRLMALPQILQQPGLIGGNVGWIYNQRGPRHVIRFSIVQYIALESSVVESNPRNGKSVVLNNSKQLFKHPCSTWTGDDRISAKCADDANKGIRKIHTRLDIRLFPARFQNQWSIASGHQLAILRGPEWAHNLELWRNKSLMNRNYCHS